MSLHSTSADTVSVVEVGQFVKNPAIAKEAEDFVRLARRWAPAVHQTTLAALVHVESGYNPYAIGIVGGYFSRQPLSLEEALAVAQLETEGQKFSMGLGRVNRYNLNHHHADYQTIFEPCCNLAVDAAILPECFTRAKVRCLDEQTTLRASLSCYYPVNFTTGHQHSYFKKVVTQAGKPPKTIPVVPCLFHPGKNPSPDNNTASKSVTTTVNKSHPEVVSAKISKGIPNRVAMTIFIRHQRTANTETVLTRS